MAHHSRCHIPHSAFRIWCGFLVHCHLGVLVFSSGVCLASDLPPDTGEARLLLRQLGPRFSADYSPHFTIISDADAARVEELRALAESTFKAVDEFARRYRLPAQKPAAKMTVLYFNTWEDYERYTDRIGFPASQWVPGFFDHHTARCIMFNYADSALIRELRDKITAARNRLDGQPDDLEPARSAARTAAMRRELDRNTAQLDDIERRINTTVFRHELAHQVLHHLRLQPTHAPGRRWLCEGLAMLFEPDSQPPGSHPELALNRYRLSDFLAIDRAAVDLSFRRLIIDPRVVAAGSEHAPAAYAVAWVLVYDLATTRPDAFARYLIETVRDDPAEGPVSEAHLRHFEKHFGPLDDDFEQRIRDRLTGRAIETNP